MKDKKWDQETIDKGWDHRNNHSEDVLSAIVRSIFLSTVKRMENAGFVVCLDILLKTVGRKTKHKINRISEKTESPW